MTAKEYLEQASHLDQRINNKLELLSSLREMATKTTSVMDGETVSHTRNVHSLQDVIVKIVDMQNEINHDIDRLVELKKEVTDVLRQVRNPASQAVLEYRYLCYRTWEEIADTMGLHIRSVYKIHGRGLQEVDSILLKGGNSEKFLKGQ